MRIVPQQATVFKGISFELGGFIVLGLILVLALHFSPLSQGLQLFLLLTYGITASLWLIGRIQYFLKKKVN
jgi:hypothetical protein